MKCVGIVRAIAALCFLFTVTMANAEEWQVVVPDEFTIVNDQGQVQTFTPSCALDSIYDPVSGTSYDNSFAFYFKPGDADKLIVFFNGGGACWDDATCVTSLLLAGSDTDRPTYNPSMYTENLPHTAGGIFDDSNSENPFADWTKVFIPYCTGDIHTGSNDYTYLDMTGLVTGTGVPGTPMTIKHRGFDNFMAVREWLKDYYGHGKGHAYGHSRSKGHRHHGPKQMLVTGSSAGGYGATMNFPYLKDAFPRTKASLFSDAAAGILSSGFVDKAFSEGQPWAVENTLPPIFNQYLGAYQADTLNQDMMALLAGAYPKARFAQYSTAYDAVQVLFYKISLLLANEFTLYPTNPYDPSTWALNDNDGPLFEEWSAKMIASYSYLDDLLPNYEFYIGAGIEHSVLTDTYVLTENYHPFYDEVTGGMPFTEWLDKFVNAKKHGKHKH